MYNIKSVAKMLEMPAVTIRAWERRYQVVNPTRSESGHRLYSEQDIEDLRWLKVQTEDKGLNISQAVKLLEKIREQREAVPIPPSAASEVHAFEAIQRNLFDALMAFEAEKAHSIVSLAFSMFHFEDIFHGVLIQVMQRIGEQWERGEASVAQEHFASMFIMQRFTQFFNLFTVNPALPRVLAFCPSGELHQIGLLLFTLFLRRNGFDVVYLGTNTPLEGLGEMIDASGIRIVAVSMTDSARMEEVSAYLLDLKARCPQVRIAVGGPGFDEAPDAVRTLRIGNGVAEWNRWMRQVMQATSIE